MIETVFVLPGVGQLVVRSLYNRDLPVIQGLILYVAVVYVLVNLLVDVLYTVPRPAAPPELMSRSGADDRRRRRRAAGRTAGLAGRPGRLPRRWAGWARVRRWMRRNPLSVVGAASCSASS